MMFCPECGAKNQDDAIFCENCGANVSQAFAEAAQPQQSQIDSNSQQIAEINSPSAPNTPDYIYQSAAAAVAVPKKSMKTATKVLIAVALFVVVLVVVLYNVALQMSSPEKVAKEYLEAVKAQDWDKAYSYLDITESDFINKTNFAASQKESDMGKMASYSIDSSETSMSREKNALEDTIDFEYTTRDSTSPKLKDVSLVKQPAKAFLFFDTWKVSADDFVTPKLTILVPEGTKPYLNGVQVADKYKDSSQLDSGFSTSYTIKNIFSGMYTFKVTSPYTEDYTKKAEVYGTDALLDVDTRLKFKQSALDPISKQPEGIMKGLYSAALAGKDFDSVKDYFAPDAESQSNMKSQYADLLKNIAKDNNGGFKSITFSNFQEDVRNSESDLQTGVNVSVKFDYSYTAVENTYDAASPAKEYSSNNTGEMRFTFQLCGDKWLVNNIGGLRLSSYNNTFSSFTY